MEDSTYSAEQGPTRRPDLRCRTSGVGGRGRRFGPLYDILRGYDEDAPKHIRCGKSVRHNARDEVGEWKRRFLTLRCMDDEAKSRLLPLIRGHIYWVAWIKFFLLERAKVFVTACSLLLLPLSSVLGIVIPQIGPPLIFGPWALLAEVSLGMALSMMGLSRLSLRQLAEYLDRMESRRRYWWVGLFFYFAAVYIEPEYPQRFKTLFGGASGMVTFLLASVAGAWLAVHALIQVNISLQREKSRVRPQSFIVNGYQNLLFFLEEHSSFLGRARSAPKRHCMSLMEEIAVVIERDAWEPLRSGDGNTDSWVRERARRMASAVRGLKKWVLTPKEDTSEHLLARIISDMTCAARGEWDALPQEDVPASGPPLPVRAATGVLRFLATVSGLLLAANALGHAPHWVSAHYGFILVAFAGIMTVLSRLDPVTAPTITSYKDILKSLEEIGKKA